MSTAKVQGPPGSAVEMRLTSTTGPAQRAEYIICLYSISQSLQEAEKVCGRTGRPQQDTMRYTSQCMQQRILIQSGSPPATRSLQRPTWAMLSVQCASSATSLEPDRHAAMSHRHARYCATIIVPADSQEAPRFGPQVQKYLGIGCAWNAQGWGKAGDDVMQARQILRSHDHACR